MITVVVQFKPVQTSPRAQVVGRFKESVPHYRDIPGLVRKYYTIGDDGSLGGIYEFKTRSQAEAAFPESWKDGMQERFGARPLVTFFDSPVMIDNVANKIVTGD